MTEKKEFVPSAYQQAIFDWILHGEGSAVVQAVAGSGKSTTILRGVSYAVGTSVFLAFNKAIITELEADAAEAGITGVEIKTFHSLGYGAWRRRAGGGWKDYKIEGNKTYKVLDQLVARGRVPKADADAVGSFVKKMVDLAKAAGIGATRADDARAWWDLMDHHDVEVDDESVGEARGIEIARMVLEAGAQEEWWKIIDFSDMLYLPVRWGASFYAFDWVFVDEAQDVNAIQLAILRKVTKRTGRLVAVGDRAQAIYGFRGADSTAMDTIKQSFGACELPLSVSYRCARAVVEAAQEYCPHIESHKDAVQGSVGTWREQDGSYLDILDGDTAMLCRNNAPLLEEAYRLIANGVGCRVRGRDIGEGLVKLIEKMKAKGVKNLVAKLDSWAERETEKAIAKGSETKALAIADKRACIDTVIDNLNENHRTVPALIEQIRGMFDDALNGGLVTLSSVHKSKGLEWQRVLILKHELMPSPFARQEWQQVQEENLVYVAYTRAKEELYFL